MGDLERGGKVFDFGFKLVKALLVWVGIHASYKVFDGSVECLGNFDGFIGTGEIA